MGSPCPVSSTHGDAAQFILFDEAFPAVSGHCLSIHLFLHPSNIHHPSICHPTSSIHPSSIHPLSSIIHPSIIIHPSVIHHPSIHPSFTRLSNNGHQAPFCQALFHTLGRGWGSPLSHPHPTLKLLRSSLTRFPSRSSLRSPRSPPVPFPSLFLTHTVHSDNRPGALHPYSLPEFFFWLWIYTHSASRMRLCLSVLQTPQTVHPLSKLLPVPCRFGPLIVLNSVDFSPSQRPGLIP